MIGRCSDTPGRHTKVNCFRRRVKRAWPTAARPRQQPQPWVDQFRWEHNHVRPHEALAMQTPASVWHRSERHYDPHPPRWEYPPGAKVLKVSSQGSLDAYQIRWRIARALAGEWVQLERVVHRVLVFYCRTLIRELDLQTRSSILVQRWHPQAEADDGPENASS